jgi:hypothetical protein
MAIFEFIVFAALAVIGAIPVIFFGQVLRRWVLRRVSLAASLAVSHAVIVAVSIAFYPIPIFWGKSPEFDDVYWIFLFVPGMHIYQLGRYIAYAIAHSLEAIMSFHLASLFVLVIIPGIVCLLIGTLQWYLLGRLWQRLRPNTAPEPN